MKAVGVEVEDEHVAEEAGGDDKRAPAVGVTTRRAALTEEQREFVRTLNNELQKFNKFFINSEEDFVMKESKLEEEYATVVAEETGERAVGCTPERLRKILREFADFHGELVLMEHWVSLNYTVR